MTPARLPADQAVRDRVAQDFDTTFLLEAGAGTGKTTVLVHRILALLRAGRAPIDRIVAITFTDKAAGELKLRLRDDIEKALEKATGRGERSASRSAADDLERAPVSTIHSFALGAPPRAALRGRPRPRLRGGGRGRLATAPSTTPGRPGSRSAWPRADPVLVRAMTCGLKLDGPPARRPDDGQRARHPRAAEETAPPFDADEPARDGCETAVSDAPAAEDAAAPTTDDDAYQHDRSTSRPTSPAPSASTRPAASASSASWTSTPTRASRATGSPRKPARSVKAELKAVKDAQEAYTQGLGRRTSPGPSATACAAS